MEVVFILLPLALLVAGIMLALFIWAARSGQFDDLETPAVRMLFDDARPAATAGRGDDGASSAGLADTEPSRPSEISTSSDRIRSQ